MIVISSHHNCLKCSKHVLLFECLSIYSITTRSWSPHLTKMRYLLKLCISSFLCGSLAGFIATGLPFFIILSINLINKMAINRLKNYKGKLRKNTINLSHVSQFLFKSFHIVAGIWTWPFSNSYIISNVTQQCQWSYFDLGLRWGKHGVV